MKLNPTRWTFKNVQYLKLDVKLFKTRWSCAKIKDNMEFVLQSDYNRFIEMQV